MNRRWLIVSGVLIACLASAPLVTTAAEVTDVADAADTLRIGNYERRKLFTLYIEDSVDFVMENGKITREPINLPGRTSACTATTPRACLPFDELRYTRNTYTYRLRGQAGLYQDVALTFGWSYVMGETTKFGYAPGVTAATSTVDNSDPAIGTNFRHDFQSTHKGSGDIELGLRAAVLSDERDASKPMWVLAFNWAAPWTSKTYNPATPATQAKPGSIGDGMHHFTFSTALSKRLGDYGGIDTNPNANRRGYVDPYIELAYVVPVASGSALAANAKGPFAKSPSQQVKLNTGFEVVPFEDLRNDRKLSIDFGLRTTYFTAGRNYSELSDSLGRLTYTEDYFYLGGVIGVYAQIASFVRLKFNVTLGYKTSHLLTGEKAGQDRNSDSRVTDPADDPTSVDVANPYYCGPTQAATCANAGQPYDVVGMRFRDAEHVLFGASASLMLTF